MNQNDPIREQFERFKQEERTWNYAEALYWMNQYKNLLEQALAVEPDKLVRLTDDQIIAKAEFVSDEQEDLNEFLIDFANAIMNDMERINGAHS